MSTCHSSLLLFIFKVMNGSKAIVFNLLIGFILSYALSTCNTCEIYMLFQFNLNISSSHETIMKGSDLDNQSRQKNVINFATEQVNLETLNKNLNLV